MREQKYEASEKIVQRMSRDGLVEDNLATGNRKNISNQFKEADFVKSKEKLSFKDQENSLESKKEKYKKQTYKANQNSKVVQQDFNEEKNGFKSDKKGQQWDGDHKESDHKGSDHKISEDPIINHNANHNLQNDASKKVQYIKQVQDYHQGKSDASKNESSRNNQEKAKNLQFDKSEMTEANQKGHSPGTIESSTKLEHYSKRVSTTQRQLEQAKKRIPKKHSLKTKCYFDEQKGKAKQRVYFEEVDKPLKKEGVVKRNLKRVNAQSINYTHRRISESEKENAGVEGAHKGEQTLEILFQHKRNNAYQKGQKLQGKVSKLERKSIRANANYQYQKFLDINPNQKKWTALNKLMQKQRIKREYQKAYRKGKTGISATKTTQKVAEATTKIMKKLLEIMIRHRSAILIALITGLLLLIITASFASCVAIFSDSVSTIMLCTWNSDPADIDKADLAFTYKEAELQNTINQLEIENPGYDQYRYNLDLIGHDPFELINYLSAKYGIFTVDMVSAELDSLFGEMYTFSTTEVVETRTRIETQTVYTTNPETGAVTKGENEVEVEYDFHILNVQLGTKPFSSIVAGRLSVEQLGQYAAFTTSKGGLQQFGTPFNVNWYQNISSYYGYRIGPTTGELELHRGIDIALPEGTEIMAAHTGTVITATYDTGYGNYVVITDNQGFTTKYAHLSSIGVAEGQTVTIGEAIGEVGSTGNSTGSHLHIEVLYEDAYFNPLFYLNVGD